LRVKVDGRRTYFEWINAGHYVNRGARGAMAMTAERRISDLYFGFDPEHLFLRLDAHGGPFREQLVEADTLRIAFLRPEGFELVVSAPTSREPSVQLYHDDVPVAEPEIEAAADSLFELAIPFRSLAVATDEPVHFFVELLQDERSLERIPQEGVIETTVPSPDYELIMWQA